MKRLSLTLIAVAVAVTCLHQVADAQDAGGVPKEIIKELSSLVGTWEIDGKVGDETQTGGFTCQWARGPDKKRCCLLGRFSYKIGDETGSGITLIGWNSAKKCIEDRGSDVNGGNARLLWTIESSTHWRGEVTRVEDGQAVESKADLIKKSPAEIVYEAESETGEVTRVVFRKVKGERKKKAKK